MPIQKYSFLNLMGSVLLAWQCQSQAVAQRYEDWKQTIIQYQTSLQKLTEPKGNQQYFLHLHLSVVAASGTPILNANNMEVRFWIRHQQMVYESTHLSVYRDAKESFTVVHPMKTISRAVIDMQRADPRDITDMGLVQQTLLENATVVQVGADQWKGRPVQRIVLRLQEEMGKKTGIRQAVYWYDEAWKRVVRQQIDYRPGRSLVQQSIDLDEINLQDTQKLYKRAADYVLQNRQLLPRYQAYSLENL